MIYVCIPSYDEAQTLGLLLWKIRQVFADFPREYQLLVLDDGSADRTAEMLEDYARVLPLTVLRHPESRGYARSVEALLQAALERTDRPKRDGVVLMHADFRHPPETLPDLIKGLESGADLVVAEAAGRLAGEPARGVRLARKWAPVLLRRSVRIPGIRDTVSGYLAVRLATVRQAFESQVGEWIGTDGWAANAELLARLAGNARRTAAVPTTERNDLRHRSSRIRPWPLWRQLWRDAGHIRVPGPSAPPPPASPPPTSGPSARERGDRTPSDGSEKGDRRGHRGGRGRRGGGGRPRPGAGPPREAEGTA